MSTENAAFTSFWCARQLSGFRVIIFCLLSSLSRRWICQPCFRSSARIANTGSRASDAATEVERPDIRPTTNNGRKISVVVVRRRRQSRLGAGRRSPAMLVCHPGCSDGKWMAAECAAGTPPCFGAALRCAATRHTAQRRAPDINEALSSRWSIGSRSAADRRPSGRRPAGKALDRRAASTLDAIFCLSDSDRPEPNRRTGDTGPVRCRAPMGARESVYRRSTARVDPIRVAAARHAARLRHRVCKIHVWSPAVLC